MKPLRTLLGNPIKLGAVYNAFTVVLHHDEYGFTKKYDQPHYHYLIYYYIYQLW